MLSPNYTVHCLVLIMFLKCIRKMERYIRKLTVVIANLRFARGFHFPLYRFLYFTYLLQWVFPIQILRDKIIFRTTLSPEALSAMYKRVYRYLKRHSSVQFSRSVVSDSLRPHELQHTRPPCPSPTPRVYSDSCPSSQWCHPAISSSVVPFSSCPQSLPASQSFPISQLFT